MYLLIAVSSIALTSDTVNSNLLIAQSIPMYLLIALSKFQCTYCTVNSNLLIYCTVNSNALTCCTVNSNYFTYLLHSQFQSCPFLLAICWAFVIIIANSLCVAFCYQRFAKCVVFYHCWPSRFLKLLKSRIDAWLVAVLSNIILHCPCSHLLDGYSYFIHFMT